MPTESKSSPRRIEAKIRQKRALELRLAGMTFEAIAEAVGFRSKQAAHDTVTRALRDLPRAQAEDLRELDSKRLDAMYLLVWPYVLAPIARLEDGRTVIWDEGKFHAIDRCLRILAQRAALLGLNAPAHQVLTGPDGGPIEMAVLTLSQRLQRIIDVDPSISIGPVDEKAALPTVSDEAKA